MAAIGPICHESGQCETNEIELEGRLTTPDSINEIKVTLGPDGSYPTWIRNGLVDILALAVKEVAQCETGTYTNKCFGTTAMAYCPQKKSKYTNCKVPKYVFFTLHLHLHLPLPLPLSPRFFWLFFSLETCG